MNATSENDAFNSNYENSSINLVAKPLLIMKKTTINLPTVIPISVNTTTTTQAKRSILTLIQMLKLENSE